MSVFNTGDAPCGVFGAVDGYGTFRTLEFVRGARTQNSAGEIETIYRPVATITGDVQPMPAGLMRELHGQVFMVKYRVFTTGVTSLHDGDRTYVDGAQVEVTQIAQYGTEHAEIDLGYMGR